MKKPRKSRPKAKPHRARAPVAAPPRAHASAAVAGHARRRAFRTSFSSIGDLRPLARRQWSAVQARGYAWGERTLQAVARLSETLAPAERWKRTRNSARALALPYHDDREALALLVLPFLLVASAVVIHQSARSLNAYLTLAGIETPDMQVSPLRPAIVARPAVEAPAVRLAETQAGARPLAPSPVAGDRIEARAPRVHPLAQWHPDALPPAIADGRALAPADPETRLAALGPPEMASGPVHAALARLEATPAPGREASPVPPGSVAAIETDEYGQPLRLGICSREESLEVASAARLGAPAVRPQTLSDEAFGLALARAAEAQVGRFVIYNDAYRRISFPMGDVNGLFGVCTDVIVRAYRGLGVDLQALVHEARAGSGDTNIDHRRTEVLRRFFAAHGASLPVSSFAEDYQPGDIVTYHRPQNQRSRSHIAMVSSVMAPSGRPMIIHNRGWGPQLEDALFVDQITGHYRYRGAPPTRNAARPPEPSRAHAHAGDVGSAATAASALPASVTSIAFPAP